MQFPRARNEINWTGVALGSVPLVLVIVGVLFWGRDLSNRVEVHGRDLVAYQTAHAEVHKDASAQRTGEISRLNTQIEALMSQNLPYRVGSLEAQYKHTSDSMAEIKTQINNLSSDQRLTNQKLDQLINMINGENPLRSPRNQP